MIALQADGSVLVGAFLAVTLGILALFLGKAINQRVRLLAEYSIPEPVTGGLIFAVAFLAVFLTTGYRISFELTARDVLLVYFFTTIGINSRLDDLRAAGRPLVILIGCLVIFLLAQNVAGVATARALGFAPAMGVLTGSASMLGGLGTAIAWAPSFTEHGVEHAVEIGALAATVGLVTGSLSGGPTAGYLIKRYGLRAPTQAAPAVGVRYGQPPPRIDYFAFLNAVLAIHLCGILGILLHHALGASGLALPLFVPCLFAGIVLTSAVPRLAPRMTWPTGSPALALIAEISLAVFLGMSLMSMQLWALGSVAGPLAVMLGVQFVVAILFVVLVVFRALGRSYDAAVVSAGLIGFGLGSTATAMASMTAVTQRHGASRVAFLTVPIVAAFFNSVLNTVVIHLLLAAM